MNQVGHQSRQSINLTLRPAVFDQNVASLNKSGFAQSFQKGRQGSPPCLARKRADKPDHRRCRLLRARRERPIQGRGAGKYDEFAPVHSITSSAKTRSDGGTVRPSAFAVLMLMA